MSIGRITVIVSMILCIPLTSMAAPTKFIENYTYHAGESDSKLTCRTVSLIEIKRLLLEKIGTYLESRTEVRDFRIARDEVVALTAGIVKLEILDEKWNGETYSMTARIEANPSDIARTIGEMRKNKGKAELAEKLKAMNSESIEQIRDMQSKMQQLESDLFKVNKDAKTHEGIINAWGLYEQAVDLRQRGKSEEAVKALDVVIRNNPSHLAYFERGIAYLDIGKPADAIADMTEVLKVRPDMKGALFFRGMAYNKLGNRQYGRMDIERAAELGSNLAKKWLKEHPGRGW